MELVHSMLNFLNTAKKFIRSFYEGGKVTKANQDFWNATSPFESTAESDRYIMMGRARWLKANNPIMANIDGAILDNVVGRGIGFQNKTSNKRLNKITELKFEKWASTPSRCSHSNHVNFYDMTRLILEGRMVDGEIFIYKHHTPDGLKIQLLEADSLFDDLYGGIVYNDDGSPKEYRFKKLNKDGLSYSTSDYIAVKSDRIIHYYRAERATQRRGVSEYKRSILSIKNFSAYQDATIKSARARANIAYSVEIDGNTKRFGGDVDEDGKKLQSVNGIMVYYLNKGEKINQHAPDAGSADYKTFTETVVRMIATGRRVSYELAFKDYQHVNFASSRASLIQDNYHFDEEFSHLSRYVVLPLIREWFELEIALGRINVNFAMYKKNEEKYFAPRLIPPQRAWVDPLKDILSIEKEISLNLTTQTDVAMARGKDFDEIVQKKAEEKKKLEDLGLWVENKDAESPTEKMAKARIYKEIFDED